MVAFMQVRTSLCFFFSSRRRHTRLQGDWSSDVCSSDLTDADATEFNARAAVLGRQFDAYEPFPGFHLKGDLTMGENIADLGGALVALDAYHNSLGNKPAPVRDGVTGDQRFFLGYAQSWR